MQKSNLVVILALVATAAFMMYSAQESQSTEPIFEEWKEKHGLMLDLSAQEQVYRLKIFERNLQVINEHNSKPNQSYKMGINKFTAYTLEEFENSFLTKIEPNPAGSVVESPAENLNLSVDWVSYGAVSPVKSQGTCVASYAFSAVGAIEGISVIFYKTQTEYSVQQIIDCSTSYGNQGCSTGNMINSFNYVKDKGNPFFILRNPITKRLSLHWKIRILYGLIWFVQDQGILRDQQWSLQHSRISLAHQTHLRRSRWPKLCKLLLRNLR